MLPSNSSRTIGALSEINATLRIDATGTICGTLHVMHVILIEGGGGVGREGRKAGQGGRVT